MLATLFILAAVILAGVEAWRARSLGWAALACLFAGVFLLPAL